MHVRLRSSVPRNIKRRRLGITSSKKRNLKKKARIHVDGRRISAERANEDDFRRNEASEDHYRSSSPVASYESLCLQVAYAASQQHLILQDDIDDFYLLCQNEKPYVVDFLPGWNEYLETRRNASY